MLHGATYHGTGMLMTGTYKNPESYQLAFWAEWLKSLQREDTQRNTGFTKLVSVFRDRNKWLFPSRISKDPVSFYLEGPRCLPCKVGCYGKGNGR